VVGATAGRAAYQFLLEDYLGSAMILDFAKQRFSALQEFGVGAGASRLISGTHPTMCVGTALAEWKARRLRSVSGSGYAAALGSIPALVTKMMSVLLASLPRLADRRRKAGVAHACASFHTTICENSRATGWAGVKHAGKRVSCH